MKNHRWISTKIFILLHLNPTNIFHSDDVFSAYWYLNWLQIIKKWCWNGRASKKYIKFYSSLSYVMRFRWRKWYAKCKKGKTSKCCMLTSLNSIENLIIRFQLPPSHHFNISQKIQNVKENGEMFEKELVWNWRQLGRFKLTFHHILRWFSVDLRFQIN